MKPKFANFSAKTQASGQIIGMALKAKGFGSGLGQRHFVRPQVYEFDNRNRLEEVRARKTGDVADQVTTYGYTDAGARDRQTHPNGTTVKYIYNPRHQLKEMLHKTAAGVLLLGLNYTLDASGLRTEIAETGQTTRVANYEYDAQKRLTLESVKASPTGAFIRSQVYEYDSVGNRRVETKTVGATVEAITSTYDRNDRLKTATSVNSTVTYQYDANGRLESQVTAPASGAATTVAYGWDSRDRMTSSTRTSGIQSSTTKFSYDPDGTRIGQTQNAGTPQAKTIRYLVDRNQPYAQVVVKTKFVHRLLQSRFRVDLNKSNAAFKRSKKAFDPAVLPRSVWVASLMANAQLLHSRVKFFRHKCVIVVDTYGFGFAKGVGQVLNQGQNRDGALFGKSQRRSSALTQPGLA